MTDTDFQKKLNVIFRKLTKEYDKIDYYSDHFVDIGDGLVMIILWQGKWRYSVRKLEKLQ